ncbi:MAG TPA: hypothetical protein PKW33_01195 [Anaerolineaceae bacterium]|nr:hypothetical protein [Anaerolineaceae bacterium]HPN50172.1 hypothetical protein [Anaerolineaceae bacterium]
MKKLLKAVCSGLAVLAIFLAACNTVPFPSGVPSAVSTVSLTCTQTRPPVKQTSLTPTHVNIQTKPAQKTSTPVPSATPDLGILLFDDFNDPSSGWSVFGDQKTSELGYANGAFHITFYISKGFDASWSLAQYDNFTAETVFNVPARMDVGAGLTIRATQNNWYVIFLYPNSQEYSVSKVVAGKDTTLIERRKSEAVQSEIREGRAYQQLAVKAYGDTIEIWTGLPGGTLQKLDVLHDSDLIKGHVGVLGTPPQTSLSAPVEIQFEWIRISVDKPEETAAATPKPTKSPEAKPVSGKMTWSQSNEDAFGDPTNESVFALGVFKEVLYAGTRNSVKGAQIWRLENENWTQVMKDGFGSTGVYSIDHLEPFKGWLYASTWNQTSETETNGAQIWRTEDGEHWSAVVTDGFENPKNSEIILIAWQDRLFAGTWNFDLKNAEIWVSSSGDAGSWTRVVAGGLGEENNAGVISMGIHDGRLYAGIANREGGRIWRTANGSQWEKVATGGLGDSANHAVSALEAFNGYLYALVETSWDNPRAQVWRCSRCDGSDWEMIKEGGFHYPDTWRKVGAEVLAGYLYIVPGNQDRGLEIWRTADGQKWEEISYDGFGDKNNRYSYFDNAIAVFQGRLFIATDNPVSGGEVWEGKFE